MISTGQIRAARGLLNWTQGELSKRTGISTTSIGAIESGDTQPRASTLELFQKAFEEAGVEFFPGDGVRKHSGYIKVLQGREGFLEFYEDIYREAQAGAAEFLVNNVDEKQFLKWGEPIVEQHTKRMEELGNITYKLLVKKGDLNIVSASYAEYRWLPEHLFASVSFYLYGKKLAFILFDTEPLVCILDFPSIAKAYRLQFEVFWNMASPVIQDQSGQA